MINVKKVIFLSFITLILGSCASTFYTPRKEVKVERDEFSDEIKILGIEKKFPPSTNLNYYFIRSWVDRETKTVTNQLYVNRQYGDYNWHFYQSASLRGGRNLEFTEINSEVLSCTMGSCEHREVFGINLPIELLEKNQTGMSIKVYGKSGDSFVIDLSANQINSQLIQIESIKEDLS